MTFATGAVIVGIAFIIAFLEWKLHAERKINIAYKRQLDNLKDDVVTAKARNHSLMRENDRLESIIDLTRQPARALVDFPEIFADDEFNERNRLMEEENALRRRMSDRYEGPKQGLSWEDQERQDFNGMGL